MLGTIQSPLVLGHARDTHLASSFPNPFEAKGVCDELATSNSSSDPGPCIHGLEFWTPPSPRLEPLEAAWHMATSAHILCPPEHMSEFVEWGTPYVHDTVTVLSNARAWESVRACDETNFATVSVDHAATEMVLTRECADMSKLMYDMRINGDVLDHDELEPFGGQLRASVSASLCGDLPDHSWWRPRGHLWRFGLRTALGVTLPAFVASRIVCCHWLPP